MKIIEIKHLDEIRELVLALRTLVIFDIDNTLIEPLQELGTVQWYEDLIRVLKSKGLTLFEAMAQANPLWIKLQKLLPVQAVETETPQLIKSLQAEGIQLMAVSSRGIELAYRTTEQLASVDIDFRPTAPFDRSLIIESPNPLDICQGIIYRRGVLLAQPYSNKAIALKRFFDAIGTVPKKLIWIDDVEKNLRKAQESLEIEVIGFRYSACDEKVRTYERTTAEKQLSLMQAQ